MPAIQKRNCKTKLLVFFVEILIVADDVLEGITVQGTKWLMLPEGTGFVDVANMAVNQELTYLNIKTLFIITGFAEIEVQHPALGSSVLAALSKIDKNVGYANIIVGAPVPRPGASKSQLKSLFHLTKQLQALCRDHPRFEFTKTGLLCYGPGGIYGNIMNERGLTPMGAKSISTQISDKLSSVGLSFNR